MRTKMALAVLVISLTMPLSDARAEGPVWGRPRQCSSPSWAARHRNECDVYFTPFPTVTHGHANGHRNR